VIRTQNLMRVLKTMNSVSEIKREDLVGLNITDITQNQRKVYQNTCCFMCK
jgi:hypothetical protein